MIVIIRTTLLLWIIPVSASAAAAGFPLGDPEHFACATQRKALEASAYLITEQGGGTCVVVGRRGDVAYLLTADHCLKGRILQLCFYTDATYPATARVVTSGIDVIARSSFSDLALLTVSTTPPLPEPLPICPRSLARSGPFPCLTVGCDTGKPTLQITSILDVIQRADVGGRCWLIAAQTAHGRSGGPLIDERGYVLGICSRFGPENRGVYQGLEKIWELCDEAALADLYGPKEPASAECTILPAADIAALALKVLIGKILVWLLLIRLQREEMP